MDLQTLLKRPSAYLPLSMSLSALAIVVIFLSIYGIVQQEDEGAAAHIYQLLIVLQVPIMFFFGFSWLPEFPKQALIVLALQVCAVVVALAPIRILEM